jgi:hypothetical protein
MEGSVPHACVIALDIGYPPRHLVGFGRYSTSTSVVEGVSATLIPITLSYLVTQVRFEPGPELPLKTRLELENLQSDSALCRSTREINTLRISVYAMC